MCVRTPPTLQRCVRTMIITSRISILPKWCVRTFLWCVRTTPKCLDRELVTGWCMASKGKAPAEASPTRARVDKKGKKVVQTPPTRASARLASLKARTSQTPPPTSLTPTMSQPAMKI
ncbi:hypothetical protein PIB30_058057 [Stylosanthes scabra]|uniref:Uncharacterized protein n=1 Tax=Stylosanthes scabra TaxID=79078 RepID=A0ABU6YIF7_9FABA|nr:hypothetical protein [Stylosanthes scabra]